MNATKLRNLLESTSDINISIYYPTALAGKEIQKNPIRLKNMIKRVEDLLIERGLAEKDLIKYTGKLEKLVNNYNFWTHQDHALGILLNDKVFEIIHLPFRVNENLFVNSSFHVKPIVKMINSDEKYYILSVTKNNIGFYKATRNYIQKVDIPNMPTDIDDALGYDSVQKQIQYQAVKKRGRTSAQGATFHGHNDIKDTELEFLENYFRIINARLYEFIKTQDISEPLLFTGVEKHFPIFKKINSYPNLLEDSLEGNFEKVNLTMLHAKSWEMMSKFFKRRQKELIKALNERKGYAHVTSNLNEIIEASKVGRIGVLYVQTGKNILEKAPGEVKDLLNDACVNTILHSGQILTFDEQFAPIKSEAVAVFRY